eukprot:COSAG02_NODE_6734_length_3394_cov_2.435508_5_plen_70_part_00
MAAVGNVLPMFMLLIGGWVEAFGPGTPMQGRGVRGVAVVTGQFVLAQIVAKFFFRNIAKLNTFIHADAM